MLLPTVREEAILAGGGGPSNPITWGKERVSPCLYSALLSATRDRGSLGVLGARRPVDAIVPAPPSSSRPRPSPFRPARPPHPDALLNKDRDSS